MNAGSEGWCSDLKRWIIKRSDYKRWLRNGPAAILNAGYEYAAVVSAGARIAAILNAGAENAAIHRWFVNCSE